MKGRKPRRPMSRWVWLLGGALFIFQAQVPLGAREELPAPPAFPEKTLYSFADKLGEADAVRVQQGKVLKGIWETDRFEFEGLPGLVDVVRSAAVVIGGKRWPAVWFLGFADSEVILTFPKMVPGKRLHIFYAVPDEAWRQKPEPRFFKFQIFAGRKLLYEGAVNREGWHQKALDLDLLYLLRRKFPLTLRVRTTESDFVVVPFALYGYIE